MVQPVLAASQGPTPSLDAATAKLQSVMEFVNDYRQNYYQVVQSPLTPAQTTAIVQNFVPLSNSLSEFLDLWKDSKRQGPDRIYAELDEDLLRVGDLDMDLFGRIVKRMNRADKYLPVLERAKFYFDDFRSRLAASTLSQYQTILNLQAGLLENVRAELISESEASRALVERCNLYYQSRVAGRMYNLQYLIVALAAAAILAPLIPSLASSVFAPLGISLIGSASFGYVTVVWYDLVDKPRVKRKIPLKRVAGVPIPHHLFEAPAFFMMGLAVSFQSAMLAKLSALSAQVEIVGLTALILIVILLAAARGIKKPKAEREPTWHYALAVFGLFLSYGVGLALPLVI